VWSALGLYPEIPGRAELLVGSPLFTRARIRRANGEVVIDAPGASSDNRFIHAVSIDGHAYARPWLPASFAAHGGHLRFDLQRTADSAWGSRPADAPPSFQAAGS
jgi:putative alpha-1,2-mannosidase